MDPDYNGPLSFSYHVRDGAALSSSAASVAGTVVAVNDAPTLTAPTSVTLDGSATMTIPGVAVDDPDGSGTGLGPGLPFVLTASVEAVGAAVILESPTPAFVNHVWRFRVCGAHFASLQARALPALLHIISFTLTVSFLLLLSHSPSFPCLLSLTLLWCRADDRCERHADGPRNPGRHQRRPAPLGVCSTGIVWEPGIQRRPRRPHSARHGGHHSHRRGVRLSSCCCCCCLYFF